MTALHRVKAHIKLLRDSEAPHQRAHADDLEEVAKLAESDTEADLHLQITNLHTHLEDMIRQRDEARNALLELERNTQEKIDAAFKAGQQSIDPTTAAAPNETKIPVGGGASIGQPPFKTDNSLGEPSLLQPMGDPPVPEDSVLTGALIR